MRILGHRGYIYEVENTIKSFEKAFELGADGVELDTQSTSDGVVVVSHDENLKRLIGYDFHINEHTISELKDIRIDGNPIPTLESVLEIAKSKNKLVDVEIKNPKDLEKVAHIVESFNVDLFFISSFYHDVMFEGKKAFQTLKFAYIYAHKPKDISQYAKEIDFLKPYIEYLTEDYKVFASITIPWTVNERRGFEFAKALNVFAIITDVVDVMLSSESLTMNEKNIYATYLKSAIVKEESSKEKGIITLLNRMINLHVDGIYLNGKLLDIGKPYPFVFPVSEKIILNLGKPEKNAIITIKTKETGNISMEVYDLLNFE